MKLERPNFFMDEDYQEDIIYGPDGRFRSLGLDFWTDVYPNILKEYIDNHEPEKEYADIFTSPDYYPIGIDQVLRLCLRPFISVFPACFEIDMEEYKPIKRADIAQFQEDAGMVGMLAKLEPKVSVNGIYFLKRLIYIFQKCERKPIQLTKYLPSCLYNDFIKEIKTPFYMLANLANFPGIKEEIDKIGFIQHPFAIKKIKKPQKYKIAKLEHCRSIIILENIEFGKHEQDFFWNLMCFPGAFSTMEGVYFRDCFFSANYVCPYKSVRARTIFNHCWFAKEFAPAGLIQQSISLESCIIKGRFDFRKSCFNRSFYINNSIFYKASSLIMDGTIFGKEKPPKENRFLITNSMFEGLLSFKSVVFENVDVLIENVSIAKPFYFDEAKLSPKSSFRNIMFSLEKNPKMDMSKKIFADLLLAYGFTTDMQALGLEKAKEEYDNIPFNDNKFKRACLIGWLAPREAAIFLSVSKSWLAKKRIADRKKKNKKSIPFVGHRKTIMYPKTALSAYRAQDWTQLEAIQKRYGIGNVEKPDIEDVMTPEPTTEKLSEFAQARTK